MDQPTASPLRSQMVPLLFLVGIFFLNFLGRVVFSPLMPAIEKDLKIGHDEAGSLFLFISVGYCVGLLASGFVASLLPHKRMILLSALAVGLGLIMVSISHHLWAIRGSLVFLGAAAGFYLPSGIATITELVRPEDWGKAISIHELAPNLGFVAAPLLAEALLGVLSWRGGVFLTGLASVTAGLLFIFWGKGGSSCGKALDSKTLRSILSEPSFWIMMLLFGLGIGASLGVYAMMPLYLVSERGMDRTWANTLVAFSRVLTMGSAILTGWVTDRIGPKRTLMGVFTAGGVVTMLVGLLPAVWVVPIVILQAVLATAFFPPGFAVLNLLGSGGLRSVAISLTVPIGFLLGGGAIAAGLGWMGEVMSFASGITALGVLLFGGAVLAAQLNLTKG